MSASQAAIDRLEAIDDVSFATIEIIGVQVKRRAVVEIAKLLCRRLFLVGFSLCAAGLKYQQVGDGGLLIGIGKIVILAG